MSYFFSGESVITICLQPSGMASGFSAELVGANTANVFFLLVSFISA